MKRSTSLLLTALAAFVVVFSFNTSASAQECKGAIKPYLDVYATDFKKAKKECGKPAALQAAFRKVVNSLRSLKRNHASTYQACLAKRKLPLVAKPEDVCTAKKAKKNKKAKVNTKGLSFYKDARVMAERLEAWVVYFAIEDLMRKNFSKKLKKAVDRTNQGMTNAVKARVKILATALGSAFDASQLYSGKVYRHTFWDNTKRMRKAFRAKLQKQSCKFLNQAKIKAAEQKAIKKIKAITKQGKLVERGDTMVRRISTQLGRGGLTSDQENKLAKKLKEYGDNLKKDRAKLEKLQRELTPLLDAVDKEKWNCKSREAKFYQDVLKYVNTNIPESERYEPVRYLQEAHRHSQPGKTKPQLVYLYCWAAIGAMPRLHQARITKRFGFGGFRHASGKLDPNKDYYAARKGGGAWIKGKDARPDDVVFEPTKSLVGRLSGRGWLNGLRLEVAYGGGYGGNYQDAGYQSISAGPSYELPMKGAFFMTFYTKLHARHTHGTSPARVNDPGNRWGVLWNAVGARAMFRLGSKFRMGLHISFDLPVGLTAGISLELSLKYMIIALDLKFLWTPDTLISAGVRKNVEIDNVALYSGGAQLRFGF